MSKLSFRARALDASKPMPIYLAEELPDLPDYSAINRAVPQMPSGMEKEEESEHHLQRAISGTGLIIPTPEVCQVTDVDFYERCYPPDYKMPKQHIHMQPLWEEQETPEYDIDTEDEKWLKQQRHPELTELKFEQMMDKLERSSGQTVVTLSEAKLLLERHDDLVTAVYDYWLNKRLTTQHPLVLSVKTENKPGQSTNNPYLAFRRRTEKMQTRKNRKNDESSYEKMLKLRRELARALTLLELVTRRERAKRDLVRLTALLAERRYAARDFAAQLQPDIPPRPQYTIPLSTANFRRDYTTIHYTPRAPSTPIDQPRQREKRPYKRRKHRHHAAGAVPRDSGVCTSSEEESAPPDDGPFAFRRKPGCFYEMPTSTLYGDPMDSDNPQKDGLFEHELDERTRFTLTSIRHPYTRCVGFARRRLGRGGRVILDRIATPLDHLWTTLPFRHPNSLEDKALRNEEVELETKPHRTPKVMTRDYHTSGKHPWRHAFRRHLARNPELWTVPVSEEDKPNFGDFKLDLDDIKMDLDDVKLDFQVKLDVDEKIDIDDVKVEPMEVDKVLPDLPQDSDISVSVNPRTIDESVRENLQRVIRKRSWSGCSDSSYNSDDSLQPVEQEFEKFFSEVSTKWLHFRPKTPPPSPPHKEAPQDDQFPIAQDTPISVELTSGLPSGVLDTFTTSEFTLNDLYDVSPDMDNSGSLDISGEDLLTENFTGLTEAQVESILSETDLKALADVDLTKDDKKGIGDDLLEELVKDVDGKDSFLLQGQSSEGRASSGQKRKRTDGFGSTVVHVSGLDKEPIYVEKVRPPSPKKIETPKEVKETKPSIKTPAQVAAAEVASESGRARVPPKPSPPKSVTTKASPVKRHLVSARPAAPPAPADHTIRAVAVSDGLKVRLQSQSASVGGAMTSVGSVSGVGQVGVSAGGTVVGLLQNGPFTAVAIPHSHIASASVTNVASVGSVVSAGGASGASGASGAGGAGARRVSAPLVQLASGSLHKPLQLQQPVVVNSQVHHVAPSKLKVLHAHPLTHSQRAQLLAQNRSLAQLPTVVSLATLGDSKPPGAALLKATPGSVAQFFEIKGGQLGKGPHLVNVLRQPQPGKASVARLDLADARKRQQQTVVLDGTLKGPRPQRVSVSLDGRPLVRAAVPVRHHIQLKNRIQVGALARTAEPSTSVAVPPKTTTIPGSVVANLLQKNVQLPKGQKIAISGPGGQPLSANVQAIAFTTAQLKARQSRLIAQPRPTPVAEIVEATTTPAPTSSTGEASLGDGEAAANGGVRRRPADTLPMEVT
ncbi:uncharacterized protein LOC121740009 isoform X2 [Aricia agestis]|uniref:uncharacterized protein LOC121740009 isoform X2 n=1 Tax=Aricia agestis TaxID=91739 RepID=UPI001C206D26|nr:uncharacterized protein LOC121740009 isoform X2 [Aricia agestis]